MENQCDRACSPQQAAAEHSTDPPTKGFVYLSGSNGSLLFWLRTELSK